MMLKQMTAILILLIFQLAYTVVEASDVEDTTIEKRTPNTRQ